MSVVDPHNQKNANFLCGCAEHTLARKKRAEAIAFSDVLLKASELGDKKKVAELILELEELKKIRELREE